MRSLGAKKESFGMQIVLLNAREIWGRTTLSHKYRYCVILHIGDGQNIWKCFCLNGEHSRFWLTRFVI